MLRRCCRTEHQIFSDTAVERLWSSIKAYELQFFYLIKNVLKVAYLSFVFLTASPDRFRETLSDTSILNFYLGRLSLTLSLRI